MIEDANLKHRMWFRDRFTFIATTMVKGKSLEEAEALRNVDIASELNTSLKRFTVQYLLKMRSKKRFAIIKKRKQSATEQYRIIRSQNRYPEDVITTNDQVAIHRLALLKKKRQTPDAVLRLSVQGGGALDELPYGFCDAANPKTRYLRLHTL